MNWSELSLAEQLGNVGSDFERAVKWKQRKNEKLAASAKARMLDQLDLTLSDNRHAGPRRREIARVREEVCKLLTNDGFNEISAERIKLYFLSYATSAQIKKGL